MAKSWCGGRGGWGAWKIRHSHMALWPIRPCGQPLENHEVAERGLHLDGPGHQGRIDAGEPFVELLRRHVLEGRDGPEAQPIDGLADRPFERNLHLNGLYRGEAVRFEERPRLGLRGEHRRLDLAAAREEAAPPVVGNALLEGAAQD